MSAMERNRPQVRARAALLAIPLLLLGGCGGCQRSEEAAAPAAREGAGAAPAIPKLPTRPPGVIRPGTDLTPAARISPPTPMSRATFEAAEPADAPAPAMDEPDEPADEPAMDEPPDLPEPDQDFGVAEPGEPSDCIIIIDADPDFGEPPLSVNFSVESQCDGPPTYSWDFGDHSPPSSDPAPVHVYRAAGEYTVRLTATAPDGTLATDEIDISVEAPPEE
jgi:hypothetical protein